MMPILNNQTVEAVRMVEIGHHLQLLFHYHCILHYSAYNLLLLYRPMFRLIILYPKIRTQKVSHRLT
jgi:hypothetical protein